jgi:hypothetical protein
VLWFIIWACVPRDYLWHIMCIGQTVIFGASGAYLTALPTIDSDACVNYDSAGIIGVIYTFFGIIFAAISGDADLPGSSYLWSDHCLYGLGHKPNRSQRRWEDKREQRLHNLIWNYPIIATPVPDTRLFFEGTRTWNRRQAAEIEQLRYELWALEEILAPGRHRVFAPPRQARQAAMRRAGRAPITGRRARS